MVIRERFSFNEVRQVLGGVLDQELHAKRIGCLCNAHSACCTAPRSPSVPSVKDGPRRVA
jgi:hypothetical protein